MESIRQRLHALGFHYFTIQPEVVRTSFVLAEGAEDDEDAVIEALTVDDHISRLWDDVRTQEGG